MANKNSFVSLLNQLLASKNNALIHNKIVLYIIFVISLGNLFYLTVDRDFLSIALFMLIGFITSFFSKNMVVILVIAVVISNVLKHGANLQHESFEDNIDESSIDQEIYLPEPVPQSIVKKNKKEKDNEVKS